VKQLRSRWVPSSALAILIVVGLCVAIPSVSSATPRSPGGNNVICTASKAIGLATNHTGRVSISGTGTGKGGVTCSFKVAGQWKKDSILSPISIVASGSVANHAFAHISLKSTQFSGTLSGRISATTPAKLSWSIGIWVVYPPFNQVVTVTFN
jgi:hypothetical protein